MHPGGGLDAISNRSSKRSDSVSRPHLTPTTFFLTRDPECGPQNSSSSFADTQTSPVSSLKETLEQVEGQPKHVPPRHRQQDVRSNSRRRSTIKPQLIEDSHQTASIQTQPANYVSSDSLAASAPVSQESSLQGSPKSHSPHSFAKSDDDLVHDQTESQAEASNEEDQDEELPSEVQDSAPQLIMPSIKMPSRRPFTDQGKQIGRFKILVAGSKGSGRTSLIKSMVQLCEDIVHVDSVPAIAPTLVHERGRVSQPTISVTEIYASTKPYPFWWSDLDESRILRRRKSVGDAVLERNICFVDATDSGRPEKIVQYLEQQLIKCINAVSQAGSELTGLLSGRGGEQVDVILYLLTKDTIKEDMNAIRRMSHLSNVVPLISKADLVSSEVIAQMKEIDLSGMSLPSLPFEPSSDEEVQIKAPYCVSSANGSDFDNMDASLLMSPEYVRPLMPSELSTLVKQLFRPNTVAFLRHISAKKLLSWYATEPRLTQVSSPSIRSPLPSTLNSPLPTSLSNSGVLIPITSEISLNTSNSYALAKVADHTQREEHLAQVRLSKWASDLQISLQRERERYEALAQSERAVWLVQRMGEEVRNGQVVPLHNTQALIRAGEKSRIVYSDLRYEAHDPLGLLRWRNTVRTRGWAALQIIGSFGVMGGLALWVAKTWDFTTSLHQWTQHWTASLMGTNE